MKAPADPIACIIHHESLEQFFRNFNKEKQDCTALGPIKQQNVRNIYAKPWVKIAASGP
jgi:hypothetical protein